MTHNEIHELGRRWADAEQRGDADALSALSVDDFALVGPLGFVLDKQQWLDRYRSGDFVTYSLHWDDVSVRVYGTAAIAIGRQTQRAAYRGAASDGQFRITHVAVRTGDSWLLAGIHLSPVATPPGRGD